MRKKLLLRIVSIAALLSFAVPAFGLQTNTTSTNSPSTGGPLTVVVNQKVGQADPTNGNVVFTVTFSNPINVSSFTRNDIVLTGTAGDKNVVSINQVAPNDGTTFEVTTNARTSGTIILTIPASTSTQVIKLIADSQECGNAWTRDSNGNYYVLSCNKQHIIKSTPSGVTSTFGSLPTNTNSLVVDSS